ncbi:tryptophan halogenase family protein [Fluviibacterium sp. DFM31]|uniref:Tryptophan halogenase family protein n=1 Tax=Meridianimarinicoccus marinus TaxID=3231483 RepID=A0ABV3L4X5_9RHOB
MDNAPIRRILIVGGGSSGWLTALYLKRFLKAAPVEITLLESDAIGTIGVGEATIPSMVRYIRQLRIDEAEFMRRCSASYKLGIRFDNWHDGDHSYFHPFGVAGGMIDGVDLFHFWLRSQQDGAPDRPYSSYSLQARASDAHRAPRSIRQGSPIIDSGAYAFHLDAGKMADYLQELSVADGVRHVIARVAETEKDANGNLAAVLTEDGQRIPADLFIDCTGFASLLIEKSMGDPWVDLGHQLLCDRAVVLPRKRDRNMAPYTISAAQQAGWMWKIPLMHRMGSGLVYSSQHMTDTAAADFLLRDAGDSRLEGAEPRFLRMRVGRRSDFWRGNVIAIGLSAGFVEPLESTGLYFVHRALDLLRTFFPDRSFGAGSRRAFNRHMRESFDEVRDFIVLHYLLNGRNDTDFWRDARSVPLPDSLAQAMDSYHDNGLPDLPTEWVFRDTSYYFILSGNGRLPRRPTRRAELADPTRYLDILAKIDAQNARVLEDLPGHRAYLDWLEAQGRPVGAGTGPAPD